MNSQHYNAEKLKALREGKEWTQIQVAERINVDRQTVYRAEAGTSASYELLCALAELYEIEVVSLLYARPLTVSAPSANFLAAV